MRILILLIVAAIAICGINLPAAADWEIIPSGTTADLNDFGYVAFNATYWIAGDGGTLLASSDNGESWAGQASGTSADLRSTHIPASSQFWLAGSDGTVLISIDNGMNWITRSVPDGTANLRTLFSRGSGVGYAVGDQGKIFYSANMAVDWETQSSGTSANLLAGIGPTSGTSNVALVAGEGGVMLKTIDAGANWYPIDTGTTADILGFGFGPGALYAVGGGGMILRSTDSGENWTAMPSPVSTALHAINASGQNSNYMVACGAGGRLIKSTDGGLTWNQQHSPTTAGLHAIRALTNNLYLACGADGIIIRTTDGGGMVVGVEDDLPAAEGLTFLSIQPNPFNPQTVIRFELPRPGAVRLDVFDVAGRRVALLADGILAAGDHRVTFVADGLASGVYTCRLSAPGSTVSETMLLLK